MASKRAYRNSRQSVSREYHDDDSPEPEVKRSKRAQQPTTSQETFEDDDYEPGSWNCTVCTFRNKYEAFKCEVCESRKGTSTRKPRLNQSVVQQQAFVQSLVLQQQQLPVLKRTRNNNSRSNLSPDSVAPRPRKAASKKDKDKPMVPIPDELIFRNSTKKRNIASDGITVVITEFKPKRQRSRKKGSAEDYS